MAIALASGATANSIALVGFGLDSGIEVAAAAVLLWRLALEARGTDWDELERVECCVHRFVGATFLALVVREIGSAALRAESKETLACSYLSFTLLLGLVANAAGGW